MRYVVYKASRCYDGGVGYQGSSCESAGVKPGAIFDSLPEAQEAAAKLKAVNPVGFTVEEYRDRKPYRKP